MLSVRRWIPDQRGTADNKGQHSIVMAALATVLAERGRHGFNSKLLIETSEEVGSPGLRAFCASHRERLAADLEHALTGADGQDVDDVA